MNEQTDIAEPSKAGLTADELDAKRISRRAAIKKAAAVAGAVWVAPTIIDSLASPAAAASSVGKGCLRVEFIPTGTAGSCATFVTYGTEPGTFTGTKCASPSNMSAADASATITVSTSPCLDTTTAITYTIAAGNDCNFVAAAGTANGSPGTVAVTLASKSLTLTKSGNKFTGIFIYLVCS